MRRCSKSNALKIVGKTTSKWVLFRATNLYNCRPHQYMCKHMCVQLCKLVCKQVCKYMCKQVFSGCSSQSCYMCASMWQITLSDNTYISCGCHWETGDICSQVLA